MSLWVSPGVSAISGGSLAAGHSPCVSVSGSLSLHPWGAQHSLTSVPLCHCHATCAPLRRWLPPTSSGPLTLLGIHSPSRSLTPHFSPCPSLVSGLLLSPSPPLLPPLPLRLPLAPLSPFTLVITPHLSEPQKSLALPLLGWELSGGRRGPGAQVTCLPTCGPWLPHLRTEDRRAWGRVS